MDSTTPIGLRERKKLRTRHDIAAAALRLFTERGFDAVTIEEIAAAAEVSPSTFVRYFPHKEDVVLDDDAARLSELTAAMAARPVQEPSRVAIRHALVHLVNSIDDDRETMLAKGRIMVDTPSLQARSLENQARWELALAASVGERPGHEESLFQARVIAATAIAATRVAIETWLANQADRSLADYLTDALALLDGGVNNSTP